MKIRKKGLLIGLITFALLFTMVPMESDAAGGDAIVRVEHEGYYSGRISGYEVQEVQGEYNMDFPTSGDIIYVIMTKSGADTNEMKVSIIVDGETKIHRSTSEPNGEIRMTWSFYVGGDGNGDDDERENNNSANDDDGFGVSCASIMSVSILAIVAAMMITVRIKKRT
jgi:hypothetical protein